MSDQSNEYTRENELEYCLLLMVYQYCQCTATGKPFMFNEFMAAGENAFSVLGINNGDDPDVVWSKIEALEKLYKQTHQGDKKL